MNFPFFVAKRYLLSKKSHNIINGITAISVVGVTIGTAALIVVLSVFNGLEEVVTSLLNSFNPDLEIVVREGKTFSMDDSEKERLQAVEGVASLVDVVEENALLKHIDKQYIARLRGVNNRYLATGALDTMLVSGQMILHQNGLDYGVMGYGVAYYLGIGYTAFANETVRVYFPKRQQTSGIMAGQPFNVGAFTPSGIFSVQQEIDTRYVVVPVAFMRKLLNYAPDEVTAMHVFLTDNANLKKVKPAIEEIVGPEYLVKDRYEQEALLYKILKSEKFAIYFILSFILIIALFNLTGSISIMMIDKKEDITFLWNMGANQQLIRRIFYFEGMLISVSGAVLGMVTGFIISWVQQTFGLLKLGTSGSFVVSAYPVKMEVGDFFLVLGTVLALGFLATRYPVRQMIARYQLKKHH